MPTFENIIILSFGVLLSILIEIVYQRIQPFIIQRENPIPDSKKWFISLPYIADILKTIIIWIFLIALKADLNLTFANLFLLGFLFSLLNNIFWMQMQGSAEAPSRLIALLILTGSVQCTSVTVFMGYFLH